MSKKIYHVQVNTTLCILAEDEREATVLARVHAREEEPVVSSVKLVEKIEDIPNGWAHCLPWGKNKTDQDKILTVEGLISSGKK